MGLLDRFRRGPGGADVGDFRYLAEWVRTHVGVEAYVEPKTTVTDVTVVLIANDGEWTRRVVGEQGARRLSSRLGIPVYDVGRTGYPQRMRDYDARRRIERKRALERELDGDTNQ
ncbi:oxidoreductase [Nocardia wallacei]|uniref:oxidoreductase n=1 Tax=Nocardia wallacei TaxID=480035 RepID=UPI00245600CF|nr:oxidoreductase [Nocardia wallacei]